MATRGQPVEVLLVEDNPADVRLTQEALKEGKLLNNLHVVEDGVEAMEFLNSEGKYKDSPRPDLVLLDLNLPRMDGREVLAKIKQDPNLRRIPVVILTTSDSDSDIIQSYDLQANCYITKPVGLPEFMHVVQSIKEFWFEIVKLPPE